MFSELWKIWGSVYTCWVRKISIACLTTQICYLPVFGWWALQTLVKICFLTFFMWKAKKGEKARNLLQNLAKKWVFWVCTNTLVECCKAPKRCSKYSTWMGGSLSGNMDCFQPLTNKIYLTNVRDVLTYLFKFNISK